MANIQVFEYQNSKVRTVDMDGEAWFVLKDVCAVLGISNNRMAADRLDDDEKGVSLIDTLGGKQEKLAMAAGVSRNDANKVLWMEKSINQCFERHNRETRLKEEMQRGRKAL